jgi:hypothetical protein
VEEHLSGDARKAPLPQDLTLYQDVRWAKNEAEGFCYVVAEVQLKNRLHKRIIAADPAHQETDGKPLLYADSYLAGEEPETFIYARHICSPGSFFQKLNSFVESILAEYPELRNRKYPLMLSLKGRARIGELAMPYKIEEKIIQHTEFFRLDLPFGATTVEFLNGSITAENQQDRLVAGGVLPQQLEAPLAGFGLY